MKLSATKKSKVFSIYPNFCVDAESKAENKEQEKHQGNKGSRRRK
jgi:hypothetical protein